MPFLGVSSLDLGRPSGWPFFVRQTPLVDARVWDAIVLLQAGSRSMPARMVAAGAILTPLKALGKHSDAHGPRVDRAGLAGEIIFGHEHSEPTAPDRLERANGAVWTGARFRRWRPSAPAPARASAHR